MKRDIKTLDDAHDILSIHGIEKSRSIVRDAPDGVESYSWVLGESRIRDKEVWICDLKDALKINDNASEVTTNAK
ncbi:hypothetical protein Q6344_04490 [Psychrobacter cibarius]|nr:hypothetical protein Q6344_04490 [Psychrobacter cibarius]